jgi:hypothetical protein
LDGLLAFRSPIVLRISVALAIALTAAETASAQREPAAPPRQSAVTKTVWPDEGPRTWTPRPTHPEISANDLRTRLYQFADDSMMGRRIGEPGNYKGTEYIAREFKRLGLKPAGDNGTYFQEMPYGPMGFDSTASRLSSRGVSLTVRSEWVPVAPTATNEIGGNVELTNVPTVFAGRLGDTTAALDPALPLSRPAPVDGAPDQCFAVIPCLTSSAPRRPRWWRPRRVPTARREAGAAGAHVVDAGVAPSCAMPAHAPPARRPCSSSMAMHPRPRP